MKKLLVAIFAFLYISTSVGATVHVHYCMGKLAGWEIGIAESKTCGKCGMQKSLQKQNGCCNDENRLIQNNTDQRITESAFQLTQSTTIAIPVSFFEIPLATIFSVTIDKPGNNSPPRLGAMPIFILNCNFRI